MPDNHDTFQGMLITQLTQLKESGVVLLAPIEQFVDIDGVECRLWRGKTLDGKLLIAVVHRIMMDENDFDESYLAKIIKPIGRPSSFR